MLLNINVRPLAKRGSEFLRPVSWHKHSDTSFFSGSSNLIKAFYGCSVAQYVGIDDFYHHSLDSITFKMTERLTQGIKDSVIKMLENPATFR